MTDPNRPSIPTEIRIAEGIAGIASKIVAGLIFMVGGGWLAHYSLGKEDHTMVYVGIGVAVFGAMLLPSIFDTAQKIYITFFPNGLPIIGGRRAGDPPAPNERDNGIRD